MTAQENLEDGSQHFDDLLTDPTRIHYCPDPITPDQEESDGTVFEDENGIRHRIYPVVKEKCPDGWLDIVAVRKMVRGKLTNTYVSAV